MSDNIPSPDQAPKATAPSSEAKPGEPNSFDHAIQECFEYQLKRVQATVELTKDNNLAPSVLKANEEYLILLKRWVDAKGPHLEILEHDVELREKIVLEQREAIHAELEMITHFSADNKAMGKSGRKIARYLRNIRDQETYENMVKQTQRLRELGVENVIDPELLRPKANSLDDVLGGADDLAHTIWVAFEAMERNELRQYRLKRLWRRLVQWAYWAVLALVLLSLFTTALGDFLDWVFRNRSLHYGFAVLLAILGFIIERRWIHPRLEHQRKNDLRKTIMFLWLDETEVLCNRSLMQQQLKKCAEAFERLTLEPETDTDPPFPTIPGDEEQMPVQ